jgi:2',3'-cyclic-nucleotide 2'-phosphodiesterase (5'-nucleotidase family)
LRAGIARPRFASSFAVRLCFAFIFVAFCATLRGAEPPPEALVVVIGDSHSAYDKVAQFVARVDRLKEGYRGVPMGILINGDAFELGNVVAKRSNGEIDLAFLAALAKRAPTILDLGNHETDFFGPAEAVAKIQATGVTVICGNARDGRTGKPLAPASTTLKLGGSEATVVGVVTDRLSTFRAAIRPDLDVADPVAWARDNFPRLFEGAPLPIVMSHAGMNADRELLTLVPHTTLFAGAHDHLQFVRPMETGTVYFQSGSLLDGFTLAQLHRVGKQLRWRVSQLALVAEEPGDPELIGLVRRVRAEHLTPEDRALVGRLPEAWPVARAASFAAGAMAEAAGADVGFIGNTTFGSGLPGGDVSRADFDTCVRFDGTVFTALVDGQRLQSLLAQSSASPIARFDLKLGGEFKYSGGRPGAIDGKRSYRIATTDWGAKNTGRYFGEPSIVWTEQPNVRLKATVLAALAKGQ